MWASSLADDLQDVIERAVQIGVKKVRFHFCYYDLKKKKPKYWLKYCNEKEPMPHLAFCDMYCYISKLMK